MESKIWDVIIIGAGPVGLSLAKELSSQDISVLVLEKEASISKHSKAITIWPPAQEVFDRFSILKEFEKESICLERVALHDADTEKKLIEFPLVEVKDRTHFPHLLIIPQYKTERILLESLKKEERVEIQFGADANFIEQRDNQIKVEYQYDGQIQGAVARFLVGADGGNSFVREALKIELEGKTFDQKAGLADIRLATAKKFSFPRLSNRPKLCIGFYIGDNIWRIIFLRQKDEQATMDERMNQSVHQLFRELAYEKIWQSEFNLHTRTAETFSQGNIVLTGDAAHLNSPVGGQGMNAGIIDTLVLAPAIIKALKIGSNIPIRDYAEQRKRSIKKGVNKNTGRITSVIFYDHGKYVKSFLRLMKCALKIPFVRRKFLLKMTLLSN